MNRLQSLALEYLSHVTTDEYNGDFHDDGPTTDARLSKLWADVPTHNAGEDVVTSETLLVVDGFLQGWKPDNSTSAQDRETVNELLSWLAGTILPSAEFADAVEDAHFEKDEGSRHDFSTEFKSLRLKYSIGVSAISRLNDRIPLINTRAEAQTNVTTSLAAFTCAQDPWVTPRASSQATEILAQFTDDLRASGKGSKTGSESESLDVLLERVLKNRIRPVFAKTKTPAITSAGRKNLHPAPQARFEPSQLDPETKPWKFRDVYATSVLSWITGQYLPSDKKIIENHFPLLIPALLSLIDDDSLSFKTRGCRVLSQLLAPLETSGSDILKRTNLASVFEDAIVPCLVSIPTITPEVESLQILDSAYPALLAVIRTRFPRSSDSSQTANKDLDSKPNVSNGNARSINTTTTARQKEPESEMRTASLTRALRHHLLTAYHHTSVLRPTSETLEVASFPYPRLSTFLLIQISQVVTELGINTTKHMQDLVPVVAATLTNPFGTACMPLLMAAVEALRAVVLNGWPRVWRWRAEVLDALSGCWTHVSEEEREKAQGREGKENGFQDLNAALKEAVLLLRVSVYACVEQDLVRFPAAGTGGTVDGVKGTIDIDAEFDALVEADERLRELFNGADTSTS